jgi:hypothetical protein
VTDTVSPITEPHLTPMFAAGGQRAFAPNTEPHPAPIFDTGPHPDPLTLSEASSESQLALEPESEGAGTDADLERALDAIDGEPQSAVHHAFSDLENVHTDSFRRSVTGHVPPAVVAAHSVAVSGAFEFVKRWKFALIVAGVWVVAAIVGLGLYYWWYTALDKTLPVFGILLYLVACMVASLLVSMVTNRPQVTALAIALMAAPLASMAATAVLHGAYYFEWIARPTIG